MSTYRQIVGANVLEDYPIMEALGYARAKHFNQARKNNTPYFGHTLEVVGTLIDMGVSGEAVIVGALHDLPKYGLFDFGEVEEMFGLDVANSVSCFIPTPKEVNHKTLNSYFSQIYSNNPLNIEVLLADLICDGRSYIRSKNFSGKRVIDLYSYAHKYYRDVLNYEGNMLEELGLLAHKLALFTTPK